MKILNSIGSLVSSAQGNKILEKISKKKEQGFFKTEAEFKQELKNNLVEVAGSEDQPLFVPKPYSAGIAFSEVHNENLSYVISDLEVLFQEINFVFSKIKSHEILFERSIIEIENLIKKLDQSIESAKIESSPENVFNKIVFNSFDDSSKKTDISNPIAKEIYFDARESKRLGADSLCLIDVQQGKLSLPKFVSKKVLISSANIVTTETSVSDYSVSFPGNDIQNIIMPSFGESWTHSVLVKNQLKEKAKLVIALDLGDLKKFNSIKITPNSAEPIFLKEIYLKNQLGVKEILEENIGLISETKTILFNRKTSKIIYLVFEQDKNKIVPYNPFQTISLSELQKNKDLPFTFDSISSQINSIIKDPKIKNVLGLRKETENKSILTYYYSFSIASIEIANDEFKNKGVYVSKAETYKNLRNFALYSKDYIPKIKNWETRAEMPSGSIEYSIIKRDYSSSGKMIANQFINLLPVGVHEVLNEALVLDTGKKGKLRFIGHKTNGDGASVEIYRNGELLIRGVDWKFSKSKNGVAGSAFVEESEEETLIQMIQTSDQLANGMYTAKYKPRFVLEPENIVIDNGVRFLENNAILIPNIINGQEVSRTDIYLQIIIRNHSKTTELTPYVDYYRLAGKEE